MEKYVCEGHPFDVAQGRLSHSRKRGYALCTPLFQNGDMAGARIPSRAHNLA
jgi:hypothetical protein